MPFSWAVDTIFTAPSTMAVLGGLTLSGRKLVISLVLAFLILHETVDAKTILGAVLITAGTLLMIL